MKYWQNGFIGVLFNDLYFLLEFCSFSYAMDFDQWDNLFFISAAIRNQYDDIAIMKFDKYPNYYSFIGSSIPYC